MRPLRCVLMITSSPFLFFFFFLLHSASGGAGDRGLISSICRNASHNDRNINYAACVASLRAAPGSECASLRGMGRLAMRLARDNATATRCYVRRLLKSKKWDAYSRGCLEDCLELYSDAIPTLGEAIKNYKSRRLRDANIKITAAMGGFTTCEDGFQEKSGVISPLTKRNNDAFCLSAIALSIMSMQDTL